MLLGVLCYWSAQDEVGEVYDSQLITAANVLALISKNNKSPVHGIKIDSHIVDLDKDDQHVLNEYAKWRSFKIWHNGKLDIYSGNLPNTAPKPLSKGFSDITIDGSNWRVFTLYLPSDNTIVEVSEKREARDEIIGNLLFGMLVPLLLAFPFVIFLVSKALQFGLRDLQRFADLIKIRSPNDLSQIGKTETPSEVLPVVEAINLLLAKLESSMAYERLFTDNAAHELRMPLATLNIQMQVILNARTEAERKSTVLELAKGVNRASHLLDQLLTLARVRNQSINNAPLNLHECIKEVIEHLAPMAGKKDIDLSFSGEENLIINSNKILFSILLNNLIENAIKYSPHDGRVEVEIKREDKEAILTITDNGQGIPVSEYENVFKRFYRLPGIIEQGSGLGLAIVQQICELMGIKVMLFKPESDSGLGVKLVMVDINWQ